MHLSVFVYLSFTQEYLSLHISQHTRWVHQKKMPREIVTRGNWTPRVIIHKLTLSYLSVYSSTNMPQQNRFCLGIFGVIWGFFYKPMKICHGKLKLPRESFFINPPTLTLSLFLYLSFYLSTYLSIFLSLPLFSSLAKLRTFERRSFLL